MSRTAFVALDVPRTRQSPLLEIALLLLAVACIGIAHILLLPPWEGYDEPAHWSYIQQLSDTGSAPIFSVSQVSADVDNYPGPIPDGKVTRIPHPDYQAARAKGERDLGPGPTSYHPGSHKNWEAQHPAFGYLLLVPVYRMSRTWGWKGNLLALRLASWALCVAGLAIAGFGTYRYLPRFELAALAVVGWPLLIPEFFPDMARLGNDSTCLLLVCGIWILLLRQFSAALRWHSSVAIGVLLGLGLLTKGFFVPITVGVLSLVMLLSPNDTRRSRLGHIAVISLVAAVIGLWWYLDALAHTGTFGGGYEFVQVQSLGGIGLGLHERFGWLQILVGFVGIVSTFIWAGTWSFVTLHAWQTAPLALTVLIPIGTWLRRSWPAPGISWAPLFFLIPMLAGLMYHVLTRIAIDGSGAGTPGWYLHILAAPLAFAWAIGWSGSWLEIVLVAMNLSATVGLWALQLSVFSGCSSSDGYGHIVLQSQCFIDPQQLAWLSYPGAAIMFASVGGLAALCFFSIRIRSAEWHMRRILPSIVGGQPFPTLVTSVGQVR